jgi:glycosyltransferase involved in cell wall biosynthesis
MPTEPIPREQRIAYLSYSTGEFDSRTARMAATAVAAGYRVTVYARWEPGLERVAQGPGYRIVRVPVEVRRAAPGLGFLRDLLRRRGPASTPSGAAPSNATSSGAAGRRRRSIDPLGPFRPFAIFPLRPIAWAAALEEVAEPADLWHGMWAGSLPALAKLRRRHGGRTIYDSRDIYLRSRGFDRMGRGGRAILRALERRWAQAADAVLTVNEEYARIIERDLRVPRPPVVMNCPHRIEPPDPPPDRIRRALDLAATTRVVLYQGGLLPERGIEESMDAILAVPGAVLVLLGYGPLRDRLRETAARPPYRGRVHVLDAVPPAELLDWTASADVMVMAIQPTTVNHRHTTPQKLFEALAVGVPVVASDLPGMAAIVRETGCGRLCDPASPDSIAEAIRMLLALDEPDRAALRTRAISAARDRYSWDVQEETLLVLYRRLLAGASA